MPTYRRCEVTSVRGFFFLGVVVLGLVEAADCVFFAAGFFFAFFLGFPRAPKVIAERNFCHAVGFGSGLRRDRFRFRELRLPPERFPPERFPPERPPRLF